MKLPDVIGKQLHSKIFRRVDSHAAFSIDYDEKKKIIEIGYKTGKIYHYLDMSRKEWKKILGFVDKGEGLGTYINREFKKMITEDKHDYYELIAG